MNPLTLRMASGRAYTLPMTDPTVCAYLSNPATLVPRLLEQINDEKLYDHVFTGKHDLYFLDLGANIGLVSLYAADLCSRIVAVEPDPETFKVLVELARPFPNIMAVNCALAPYPGPCKFFQNDLNPTASSTVNTYGTQTTVQGKTLMQILSESKMSRVDFCKVDVEGAEGESLSLDQLLRAKPIIHSYQIETHNCPETKWEHKLSCLVHDLSQVGYKNMTIKGDTVYASQ